MKVMLEQDHLKDSKAYNFTDPRMKDLNEYSSQLIRELIIPKLTKEVNSSKRYAALRQVFFSLVMARWFKDTFQGKPGQYAQLIDSHNLNNLTSKQAWSKTYYFNEYQKSFEKGEYSLKEQVYTPTGQVVRSYVSGGIFGAPESFMPSSMKSINPKVPTLEDQMLVKNGEVVALPILSAENGSEVIKENTSLELRKLTARIKRGELHLEQDRKKMAIEYLKQQLGERIVGVKTVGNNEIVAVMESYIRDKEITDVQVLFLEGEYTDKIIGVLKNISAMASQSLGESLAIGVEVARKIGATQEDLEVYIPRLKQRSAFYVAEEIAKYKNQAEY